MNKQEQYKKNQRKAKILKVLTPIVFWVMLALAFVFFIVALSTGLENINEIYDLLDSKTYNDTEIAEHYSTLCDKYGEWVIGQGTNGFTIHFIDFKGALFSGLIVAMVVLGCVFFVGAFLIGKWILPMMVNKLEQENQDMVNLTILANEDKE